MWIGDDMNLAVAMWTSSCSDQEEGLGWFTKRVVQGQEDRMGLGKAAHAIAGSDEKA